MWPNAHGARGRAAQKLILAGFAVLLAGVLPFVCWGSSAEPGHAHQAPHFVFGAPLTHVHTGPATHPAAQDATGVARPALLLLALVGVALAGTWHWPSPRPWRAVRRGQTLPARTRWVPVPTPPPR